MVWWGASWKGELPSIFANLRSKQQPKCMRSPQLIIKLQSDTLFEGDEWIFQQDSALAHKSKRARTWLENNVPNCIRHEDWTSGSPDLNPLDYNLWNVLEEKACRKHPSTIQYMDRRSAIFCVSKHRCWVGNKHNMNNQQY